MKRQVPKRAAVGECRVASFNPAAVTAARRRLPRSADAQRVAACFGVLGNPARLSLLLALKGRELCVCDCARVLDGSVSGASQHLKELRRLGAITFRTAGRMAYYRIADPLWLDRVEETLAMVTSTTRRKVSA